MNKTLRKLKTIWNDRALRTRLFVVLALLVVFRLLAAIPVPGIDSARLASFLTDNQFFGVLNIFAGGGLSNLSIVMLGVGPYITASIVMQLATIMIPRLKQLYHEEGEAGRKKFAQYSRILTVPAAILQGLSILILLQRQGILEFSPMALITNLIVVVGGALLLMWIGEIMTEYGISNGVSILIFAGIVAAVPQQVGQLLFTFDVAQLPYYIAMLVLGLLLVVGVVYVTEAERPLPVTYARQVRGARQVGGGVSTYIPLRVNQAGVMPIIFALSILLLPQLLGGFLDGSSNETVASIGRALILFTQTTWLYSIFYFAFVFIFTYFYTSITFDPHAMSENLQKSGAFIPGIRPGLATEEYIGKVVSRITLVGAVFLGIIAVLPLVVRALTGISAIAIGGTALLIVVSVILDLVKKVDAQASMHEY